MTFFSVCAWSAAVLGGGSAGAALGVDGPMQAGTAPAITAAATSGGSGSDDDRRIRESFALSGYSRLSFSPQFNPSGSGRVTINIDLGNGPTTLVLDPRSVRAPAFEMVVHGLHGAAAMPAPPITTYRGVDENSGAMVAASIVDGRVSAAIRPDEGEAVFIQPTAEAGVVAGPDDYVVYRESDVVAGDWRCGGAHECDDCGGGITTRGPGGGCIRTVELLFDTDVPFFQRHTSVATTVSDVENIVNQCDVIYRRDVGVSMTIRQVNVRTDVATDPYADLPATSVDPSTILNRVGTVWNGTPTPSRDLVHLMTGRDLNGTTIGIAWLSVVCRGSSRNGVSQSLFTNNLAMRTNLTAHELGHNFGANHDASGNYIMAPSVSPSSQLVFSPESITAINAHVASYGTCLTSAGPVAAGDSAQTQAGQQVLIDVLANDSSSCGYSLSLSLPSSSTAAGGSVAISTGTGPGGRNQIRYTPPANVPPAGLTDSFSYRITEATTNLSITASVGVAVAGVGQPPCAADFNDSGVVSVQDLFDFLAAYFADNSSADVNESGSISVQDLFDFIRTYFTPCP